MYCAEKTTYTIWVAIKSRCTNENNKMYKNYGGRGIHMCTHWEKSFENFIKDMGLRPSEHYSLDRINVNKGYYKGNCRWATRTEQANNKRNTIKIKNGNKILRIIDIHEQTKLPKSLIRSRIKYGKKYNDIIKKKKTDAFEYNYNGTIVSLDYLCSISKIDRVTIRERVKNLKWSVEDAITIGIGLKKRIDSIMNNKGALKCTQDS